MISDIELKKKFEVLQKKLRAGLFDEVIEGANILLNKRKHQVLFNIISLAYQSKGDYEKSIKIMELALKANSENPHFLNNIGLSYHKLDEFIKAEDFYKRGLKTEPRYLNILNNLGNLKRDLNLTEEAIEYYKKTIEINDKLVEPLFNLSLNYESLGKFEEAKECLKKIFKLNPKFTDADRVYSSIIKYTKDHEHYTQMKYKLDNENLNDMQKSHLYFGLAKYFEDIENYEISFEYYSKGNKIIKDFTKYDFKKDQIYFEKLKNFDYEKLNIDITNSHRNLIFIVGMPRSGTSLIEQILSSHDNVFGGGELAFLEKITKKIMSKFETNKEPKQDEIIELILNCKNEYLNKISNFDNSKAYFTDKAPLNFRYIGIIKSLFPNSRIINCIRDPLNIGWSNFKNFFSGSLFFSNSLTDIGKFYLMYKETMNHWTEKYPDLIYNIEYSKLIENPKSEIEKLLQFCKLNWDEKCLNHHNNKRSIKTASSTQARKPIYKTALTASNKFDKYLGELKKIINP